MIRHPNVMHEPSQSLTGAIGGDYELSLEHCWYRLIDGDTFLICTDGLNKEVNDGEIQSILDQSPDGEQALSRLVELYRTRGARDNVGLVYAAHTS